MRSRDSHATDEELASRAAGGDGRALEVLLGRHFDYVNAVCRRILWRHEHADALEQARQEALLRIARGITRFSGDAKFTTWAHRIATNAALDAFDRLKRTPIPVEMDRDIPSVPAPVSDQVEARAAVDECLETLGDPYRDAVILCFLAELDYAEIGERLDLALGTVKSRVARGRQQLKDCLGEKLERS